MGYSPTQKSAVLKRMLPPNTMAIRRLSQDEGISEATLHKWRAAARGKGQLLPDADVGPQGWSSRDKFAAVLETAALNEADLAEYCRKRGLYLWRRQYQRGELGCSAPRFRPVEFLPETSAAAAFAAPDGADKIEVGLLNGRKLVVPTAVSNEVLARFIAMAERA